MNQSSPEIESSIICPKCGHETRILYFEKNVIHRCRGCGGLWMRATVKERLLTNHAAVQTVDSGDEETGRTLDRITRIICPEDHSRLIHQVDPQQPHVGFESCTVCGGVFLDAGELRDLEDFTMIERLRTMFG